MTTGALIVHDVVSCVRQIRSAPGARERMARPSSLSPTADATRLVAPARCRQPRTRRTRWSESHWFAALRQRAYLACREILTCSCAGTVGVTPQEGQTFGAGSVFFPEACSANRSHAGGRLPATVLRSSATTIRGAGCRRRGCARFRSRAAGRTIPTSVFHVSGFTLHAHTWTKTRKLPRVTAPLPSSWSPGG